MCCVLIFGLKMLRNTQTKLQVEWISFIAHIPQKGVLNEEINIFVMLAECLRYCYLPIVCYPGSWKTDSRKAVRRQIVINWNHMVSCEHVKMKGMCTCVISWCRQMLYKLCTYIDIYIYKNHKHFMWLSETPSTFH